MLFFAWHGKSPSTSNYHLREYVFLFQSILSKSKKISLFGQGSCPSPIRISWDKMFMLSLVRIMKCSEIATTHNWWQRETLKHVPDVQRGPIKTKIILTQDYILTLDIQIPCEDRCLKPQTSPFWRFLGFPNTDPHKVYWMSRVSRKFQSSKIGDSRWINFYPYLGETIQFDDHVFF